jgi:actin-related protein
MTTHIVPIVNGEVQMKDIKRINVGGYHSFDLLYKHLNLKYPGFKAKLTQNYSQAIMENLTFAANDYKDQLNYFRFGRDYFQNKSYTNKVLFENNQITAQTLHKTVQEPIYLEFPVNVEQVNNLEVIAVKVIVSNCGGFKAKTGS